MRNLIIVESPTKALTISGFLGKDYVVVATKGHIKNLPRKEYAVIHIDGVYSGKWEITKDKKNTLKYIKDISLKANNIYIATDDDREGERIAWDVVEFLKIKNYNRIIFHEITKEAINYAISNSAKVDENLVKAQMARRLIDRILGYKISEMLRNYARKNKFASNDIIKKMGIGRVTAAALALIVENEEKIEKFIPKEYEKIRIDYMVDNIQFSVKSKLLFDEDKQEELKALVAYYKDYRNNPHIVEKYKRKTKDYAPPPPLTTSWLLRGINSLFGYLPRKTMKIAQELYEGIEIDTKQGRKRVGLITYMRTDSYNISDTAIYEMGNIISKILGEEYLYNEKRSYKNNNDYAQNAHEAIRPVNFALMPKSIKSFLTEEQYNIYSYIYYRTITLQLKSSIYDNSSLIVNIGNNKLFAYANKMEFDGWEKIGKFWKSETNEDFEENALPTTLYPGQKLKPLNVTTYKYTEKTPPRYGVGRFITILEKHQIARPSTISGISEILKAKEFIKIINTMQHPTELGKKVFYFLKEYAPEIVDLEHCKTFETNLDKIAKGEMEANELIQEYENIAEDMANKLNYTPKYESEPEPWLKEKILKIAKEKSIFIPPETLNNYAKAIAFLKKYGKKQEIIGKCPLCKQNIIEGVNNFYCKNSECDFVIWKDTFSNFFERFEKFVPKEYIPDYLKIILKKKKCYIPDLFNAKTNKKFSAYISLKYNDKYKNWGLNISFPKSKTVPKDYIVQHEKNKDEEKEQMAKKIKEMEKEKRLLIDKIKKDHLTRAFNRQTFDIDIDNLIKNKNPNEELSLAFIDIDFFKKVNDNYGHQIGDEILKQTVNILFDSLRKQQVDNYANIYRYGGEEFIIIFNGDLQKIQIVKILNTIRKIIENKFFTKALNTSTNIEENVKCTISIGCSFYENNDTPQSLIKRADDAVYRAKKNGRNRIEY